MIKEDFPIFSSNSKLVYLDNAATTHKPNSVIKTLIDFYSNKYGSFDGFYGLSQQATQAQFQARQTVAKFINSSKVKEIIFTKGCTESINLVAQSLFDSDFFGAEDEILISEMEHHANFVPWQIVAKKSGAKLKLIPILDSGDIDYQEYKKMLNSNVKLVAITHVSNALGTVNNVQKITHEAKKFGSLVLVDGAQAVAHLKVDVQKIGCDFYAFSGHKMYASMGIGVLWGKSSVFNKMIPYQVGGKMVDSVALQKTTYQDLPFKFEAGTPNIAGALSLQSAISYLQDNWQAVKRTENIVEYALSRLKTIKGLKIVTNPKERVSVISFLVDDLHPADLGMFLADKGICLRVGNHCTQPLMKRLGVIGTCRISFGIYNTKEDIDYLLKSLEEAKEFFE